MCRLGVSYNLLDCNLCHLKIAANYDSFVPLKHLQKNNHLFYDLYTTHVHYQQTQMKK